MGGIRRRRWTVLLFGLLAAAAGFVGLRFVYGVRATPVEPASVVVPVTVARVVAKTVPVALHAVGNVEAKTTVAVKARVDGQIVAVHFREGQQVESGALLFEIDPRPFRAALQQAEANLLRDRALLDRAQDQERRYRDLLQQNFISADAYAQVRTNAETAAATVRADDAAIAAARLQLDYCSIRSPITGYVGKIMIQQGNLVKANDTAPLVVINQVVPIYVSFAVPEKDLPAIRARMAAGRLAVRATLTQGAAAGIDGALAFVDNTVDTTTGTIRLEAEFDNRDKVLWPGQFVDVVLTLFDETGAIVAPNTALQQGPNGPYVYVVRPDDTVEARTVSVARSSGNDAVIATGLAAGEVVVTGGQIRLAPGTHISVVAAAQAS